MTARWPGLAELARPGGQDRRLGTGREATVAVDGRSLVLTEHLSFDQPPDAVTVVVPEAAGRPLRIEVDVDDGLGYAVTSIDTDGMKEWRSFWGPLPRVHQLDLDPAPTMSWTVRVTPALRVATEAGHHHYHRSLYGPLADRVVEHRFRESWLADPDGGRARLADVDLFHLHWPEWFVGNRLDAARAFLDLLADTGVRLVWTQHNLVPHHDDPAHDELYQLMAGAAAGVAHHSAWGLARATERYDYAPDCVHRVIPHGHWGNLAGAPDHDRRRRRGEAEAELGLAPTDLRLGIVDRAPPLKNLFIRQAAGLTGEVPRLLKGEAL